MLLIVDRNHTVLQLNDGSIQVTRPTILGEIATHTILSPHSAAEIAKWMEARVKGIPTDYIQNVFPNMKDEDREFLISGITPERWAKMFPKEDE